MTRYGYARVSTGGQKLDIQLSLLRNAGCTQIFCEKESGMVDERAEFVHLLRRLRPGDVVVFAALDRVSRGGPFKMLFQLHEITSRGASYSSLAEPGADSTEELGEIFAAIVGWASRKAREDLLRRTAAGRKRAMAKGVRFGRRPKLSATQRAEALRRCAAGEAREVVARDFNVSATTIFRLQVGQNSSVAAN